MGRAIVAALAVIVAALGGCGGGIVIHREVPRPAAIPAHAYPVVYVAATDDDASRDAADAIAHHLEADHVRVVRVGSDALLAQAATEHVATLALLVAVTVGETVRTQMSSVPMMRCAPDTPCYGYPERLPMDVRVQIGVLSVRALDPVSQSELGHAAIREEESEPSPIAAQLAVLERLRARAPGLFEVQIEILDVELDPIESPRLAPAIDDARAGRFHQARLALEAALADPELDARSRAAASFDLGQLIRLDVDPSAPDPVAEEAARLAAAETQLLVAIRLAPDERHERALTQLRAERTAREDVRAQATAAELNFSGAPP